MLIRTDGVTRPSLALVTTNNPPTEAEPQTAKSVTFIPLSPRSRKTLKRHREEKEASEGEGYFDRDKEDEDEDVEELPERFGEDGTPLGGTVGSRSDRMHSRHGEFIGPGMVGQWGVSGTDQEAIERIVRNVTGVLEGRGSWLGLLGGILSGNLLQGLGEDEDSGRPEKVVMVSEGEGREHEEL